MFRLLTLFAAVSLAAPVGALAADVDHSAFDALLKANVKGDKLDYAGFKDNAAFKGYLETLAKTDPASLPSDKARLALWINAYNAYTISAVLAHWPGIKSVGDPYPDFGFFKQQSHTIGGKKYSLNDIENEVIRKQFQEPRIHAALNCASISCPPLAPFAFTADKLEQQLQQVFTAFANDPMRNQIDAASGSVKLSQIFNWYGVDFKPSVQAYLAPFIKDEAKRKALTAAQKVEFLEYDWGLNRAK